MFGYIAAAAAVIFLVMGGIIKYQHVNNVSLVNKVNTARIGQQTAEAANKALVLDTKRVQGLCADASKKFDTLHLADLEAQKQLRAKLAAKDKENSGQRSVIANLDAQAHNPQTKTKEQQCAATEKVLDDLNRWVFP